MRPSTSLLHGLDPGGLFDEGLRSTDAVSLDRWTPPTLAELAGLSPRYEVLRLIGRGAMGAVYEARQVPLDRPVALKVLPPELGENEEFVARFRREARLLGSLQHPNILALHDFGRGGDGYWFFAMELADRADLAERLQAGSLPLEELLPVLEAVLQALEAAHAQGVIHRDIKPSNILRGSGGVVKVADFGLAVAADRPEARLTRTGLTFGTFEYASPEQAAGRPVDARSDLYSVGVLAYEALTGRLPQGVFDPPSRLRPGLPSALDACILRALQNEPARRFQTAAEMRAALRAAVAPPASRARRVGWAAAATLALAGALGGWWLRPPAEPPPAPTQRAEPSGGTQVAFWGRNHAAQGNIPAGLYDAIELRAGWDHNLALLRDRTVIAWGLNTDGQINVPTGLANVRAIAAGAQHSLALREDGTVVAWGRRAERQCEVPPDLRDIVDIAAGWRHSVALRRDGTVAVWGDNGYGQLNVPAGLGGVRRLSAGNAHTLALREDGSLVGWGDNVHGQCTVPADLGEIVRVEAGGFHNLALRRDGSIVVWGNNDALQMRVPPAALRDVQAICAGRRHSLVLGRDGRLHAWGENRYGQCEVPESMPGKMIGLAAGAEHSLVLLERTGPGRPAPTDRPPRDSSQPGPQERDR